MMWKSTLTSALPTAIFKQASVNVIDHCACLTNIDVRANTGRLQVSARTPTVKNPLCSPYLWYQTSNHKTAESCSLGPFRHYSHITPWHVFAAQFPIGLTHPYRPGTADATPASLHYLQVCAIVRAGSVPDAKPITSAVSRPWIKRERNDTEDNWHKNATSLQNHKYVRVRTGSFKTLSSS